jgi:Immunity protein 53
MLSGPPDDLLGRLQAWYAAHADGDWEHDHRIRISTLDNPGWSLSVNVADTAHEGRTFTPVQIDRTDTDWVHCSVEESVFQGRGGPLNLRELVSTFLDWAG